MKKVLVLLLLTASVFSISSNVGYEIGVNKTASLKVVPMPIVKTATVSSNVEVKFIEVYSILGEMVIKRNGVGELDFTDLPSGYYMIKAYTPKGEIVKRVQKR